MLETLEPLMNSQVITGDTKKAIEEAWESKLKETRDTIEAELRAEFAKRYEHDKSVMVESLDKMIKEGLAKEIAEFKEDKKLLQRVHKYNDEHVQKCVALVQELEIQTNLSDLDIEFGIDDSKELYLFQLRPISTKARKYILEDEDLYEQLDNIQQFIHSLSEGQLGKQP